MQFFEDESVPLPTRLTDPKEARGKITIFLHAIQEYHGIRHGLSTSCVNLD